jgi:phosphate transport system protein
VPPTPTIEGDIVTIQVRSQFRYELEQVEGALLQLSQGVQHAIDRALWALLHDDVAAAQRVKRGDRELDERRAGLEEHVLRLIAAQQPLANDLRFLLATVHIADELERMGDYAKGIASLTVRGAGKPDVPPPEHLPLLARSVRALLRASVEAFVARDATAAMLLERADDAIDQLTREIQAETITSLRQTPGTALRALHYLFVAHNLERIADRAVNIGERTIFIVTGKLPHS